MALHVGIVACSAAGAALCYRTFCLEGAARVGRHGHPEVSMHTHPLARYMERIYEDDWDGVAELMLSSATKLASIGAELLVCPDNTIHQAFARVAEQSPVPWLHIAEVVGEEALARGRARLGILGTRYLMEGPVYADALTSLGIETVIPAEDERARINSIIFDELVAGVSSDVSRAYFNRVIARLRDEDGCDAVVLGCTEIPLLVRPDEAGLPTLDSTRLLARAALRRACE